MILLVFEFAEIAVFARILKPYAMLSHQNQICISNESQEKMMTFY